MPYPEDLLEQAHHLARREPKRPKQASLRRAISTAYYALFHLLIAEAVRNWRRPQERNILARMFDHSLMKRASAAKHRELTALFEKNPSPSPGPSVGRHLLLIAETFMEMQQHRHAADYDNSRKWTRTDVIANIDLVDAAFKSLRTIRKEASAQDYLVTLLLKER